MAQADGSIRIEAIVSDEKAKKKLDQLKEHLDNGEVHNE
jgi:hypothetical protein